MYIYQCVSLDVILGRDFPDRHGYQLIVETRFQGEVLQSDPVSHISQPLVNTELAWSLSKKSLHQHRLQRTPIKLQVSIINCDNMCCYKVWHHYSLSVVSPPSIV